MNVINLTPHAIAIISPEEEHTVEPSGELARCTMVSEPTGMTLFGVPIARPKYGPVTGLPEPTPGTFYIVSALVRSALPTRTDLLSPGDPVRNEAGQVVGCKSLHCN